ncbi:SigE family RNA polymerase sigma factor [Kribbella qitaiheensis]|uniref:SigE family RNA polymerase sigma factor n=1 Tax=Kribbella qitaiheensis TaxID=1544730 RepID=A0A7G6X1Z2_9ACTN|nr:SigE family RNA polymerase sigma factor [Kribbella qitaiheensis]QNE20257.1 SigE family RNA polymerase sigma factor [Kribbella qitaiheensis]
MTVTTGEAVSFDEAVRANERRLLRLALMLSGGVHSAEDLVQTVLARAHRRWDRIGVLEHPEAYLRTMVVNEFLSWRRLLRNREQPLAELPEQPAGEDFSLRQAQRDAAWRLLARLPRQQRAVLVLRFYEDLPDDEIAAVLGCTASTVRSNAARGLASLRAGLPTQDEEH